MAHPIGEPMTIFNFGSINIDLVFRVPHIPQPGETILSTSVQKGLGGKGANTSIALAKAGASVRHVGAISSGDDWILQELALHGVNCDLVQCLETETGQAIVQVADDGENAITLASGANHVMPESILTALFSAAQPGDWLVVQNETAHVRSAIKMAEQRKLKIAYVAAPFCPKVTAEIVQHVDLLAVNQVEASQLIDFFGAPLSSFGIEEILVTKGADGATVYHNGKTVFEPAIQVPSVVDTTSAGDTFFGFYLASRIEKKSINQCLRIAIAAASCAIQVSGASCSIPDLSDVEKQTEGLF